MKKITFLLTFLGLLAINSVNAQTWDCGAQGNNLTATLSGGTLTISGSGAMEDYTAGTSPWYSYISQITQLIIESNVTTIGDSAFYDCTALTSIKSNAVVPPTLGNDAFLNVADTIPVYVPCGTKSDYEVAWSYFSNFVDKIASGTCGAQGNNLTWELCSNGTLTISGSGDMEDYYTTNPDYGSPSPWYSYITQITQLIIGDSVTTIGDYAFSNCNKLTGTLIIPNSVTTIGNVAFAYCKGFNGSLIIGNSVTNIGDNAFLNCTGFTGNLIIPNSVTTIGGGAFYFCSGFTDLTIGNAVTSIGSYAFLNCSGLIGLTIPNSVTSIGGSAFKGCTKLTTVNFNAVNCTTMGSIYQPSGYSFNINTIFDDCTSLKTLNIGSQVQNIPDYAFAGCTKLAGTLTIPNSVKTIGEWAFAACFDLTSVNIPNSVTTIGNYAFNGCLGLTSFDVDSGNNHYSSEDGVLLNKNKTVLICCPRKKTGSYIIPNSVITIGDYAFEGCNKLTGSLIIPNSVTTIGWGAFGGCSGLTEVTIPSLVTTIGDYAFASCDGLTTVTNLNLVPQKINATVFNGVNISQCTLKVAKSAFASYKYAAVWKDFIREGIDITGIDNYELGIDNSELTVYPNPTNGQISIRNWQLGVDNFQSSIFNCEIYDISGRVVHVAQFPSNGGAGVVDISHLESGIYYIKIANETVKIIKN